MRRPPRNRATILAALATSAAAGLLFFSSPGAQRSLRSALVDPVVSAQAVVLARYESGRQIAVAGLSQMRSRPIEGSNSSVPAVDEGQLARLEQTCRRLQVENARLQEELSSAERYGLSPVPASARAAVRPLIAVRAAVISQGNQSTAAERFLNAGRAQGIAETDAVLDASAPHLDQGSDSGIEPELDVLIGRCVVGRIASVGRWASALEPTTDPRYRGLAQIVRPSDQGGSFGAEGILVGQGTEFLKLVEVPTTQSVRVGDEVYTSDRDRRFPIPLYYGRVVRVEESGRNWEIWVRPAVRASELKTVEVLKFDRPAGKTLAE
jgi:cell shape-determining protein MreC